MKNLVAVILVVLFSFTFVNLLNAQQSSAKKMSISKILVKTMDAEDSTFTAVAVREELIRTGKINLIKDGDILQVTLATQFNRLKKSETFFKGRNGKWGEITLTIESKKGDGAAVARDFVLSTEGGLYYNYIQKLAKKAAERFQYVQ